MATRSGGDGYEAPKMELNGWTQDEYERQQGKAISGGDCGVSGARRSCAKKSFHFVWSLTYSHHKRHRLMPPVIK
ncbi:hypothetical protein E2562_027393 [Oryza meyeriana var. granulata]|uniref:Uncharacterized protein n=1 Tax=Oryza meyeriana var. granulata TaxID=110450 RepID=A0A6G1EQ57_9ORYZ|nr:hypothetical protein E2562_027393 [Oryza meyeriana var. granulata]